MAAIRALGSRACSEPVGQGCPHRLVAKSIIAAGEIGPLRIALDEGIGGWSVKAWADAQAEVVVLEIGVDPHSPSKSLISLS